MSCGSGMHPKIIYRSSANVGTTKALDRVVARIAREEAAAPTDPTPGDEVAARLLPHFKEEAKERQAENARRNQPQNQNMANLPHSGKGLARDKAGEAVHQVEPGEPSEVTE